MEGSIGFRQAIRMPEKPLPCRIFPPGSPYNRMMERMGVFVSAT